MLRFGTEDVFVGSLVEFVLRELVGGKFVNGFRVLGLRVDDDLLTTAIDHRVDAVQLVVGEHGEEFSGRGHRQKDMFHGRRRGRGVFGPDNGRGLVTEHIAQGRSGMES